MLGVAPLPSVGVLFQLGDIFDRGDGDLPAEEWVYRLAMEARQVNGAVYSILGNHEVCAASSANR